MTTTRPVALSIGLLLAAAPALASCGGDDDSAAATNRTTTTAAYAPNIDPASFTDKVTNPWFPLEPGTTFVYEGTEDGEKQHNEVTVTKETRVVAGVTCVVVHDAVYVGGTLTEDTYDWYAQDTDGSVWYFGEDTKELNEDGSVDTTKGSWEAGVDGAFPGIVMLATPTVDRTYRQEYRKGEAEDMATVLRLHDKDTVPAGTYDDVLVTKDFTPLEPDIVEEKRYARGVGFVSSDLVKGGQETLELVRIEHA